MTEPRPFETVGDAGGCFIALCALAFFAMLAAGLLVVSVRLGAWLLGVPA